MVAPSSSTVSIPEHLNPVCPASGGIEPKFEGSILSKPVLVGNMGKNPKAPALRDLPPPMLTFQADHNPVPEPTHFPRFVVGSFHRPGTFGRPDSPDHPGKPKDAWRQGLRPRIPFKSAKTAAGRKRDPSATQRLSRTQPIDAKEAKESGASTPGKKQLRSVDNHTLYTKKLARQLRNYERDEDEKEERRIQELLEWEEQRKQKRRARQRDESKTREIQLGTHTLQEAKRAARRERERRKALLRELNTEKIAKESAGLVRKRDARDLLENELDEFRERLQRTSAIKSAAVMKHRLEVRMDSFVMLRY